MCSLYPAPLLLTRPEKKSGKFYWISQPMDNGERTSRETIRMILILLQEHVCVRHFLIPAKHTAQRNTYIHTRSEQLLDDVNGQKQGHSTRPNGRTG